MAMRPRGGGSGGGGGPPPPPRRGACVGGVPPPNSNWQQDNQSHILNIHLTGFKEEQINVSTKVQNTIRVRAERLVGKNWSRFRKDFQVPENGEMNSVRYKFQEGTLTITVPKKEADKPHETLTPKPKSNDVQKQPAIIKDQDKVFPEASTSQQADEKSTQKKTLVDPSIKQGHDKAFSQSAKEKSLNSQKASDDYRRERDKNGDQRDTSITPFRNIGIADAEKERSERKEKNIASDMVNKEMKKNAVGTKELPEGETAEKTAFGKDGATGIPENKADNKELNGAITKEKYKKVVKGLAAELNEERQLLVNMGVAMLLVVALTAYVTYKFTSGKDKN